MTTHWLIFLLFSMAFKVFISLIQRFILFLGVFIFIFYVLLREEVLKLLGFKIKSKEQKPSVGQKRSGLTDSSFFDPATPISEIPEETFFQAISQKSSSNISTKPLHQGSPKLLRNRHVFWKSPTIRPEAAGNFFIEKKCI